MKTDSEPVTGPDAKLLATLKRYNPTKIIAHRSDDEAQTIAVPVRRKKWVQVIAAIQSRSWVSVDLLDKSGALLFAVDNTEPARELESLEAHGGSGNELRLAERIVALVLKGQRDTMAFRDAEVSNLLKAQGDVMRELTSGMKALTALYQQQIQAAQDLTAMQVEAQHTDGGGEMKQLLEAAPQILQALPIIKSLLNGKAA